MNPSNKVSANDATIDKITCLPLHSPAHSMVIGTLSAMWKGLTTSQLEEIEELMTKWNGFPPFVRIQDFYGDLRPDDPIAFEEMLEKGSDK